MGFTKFFLQSSDICNALLVKRNFACFSINPFMEKQCVKFKLNLKLLAFHGNAQNVKRIVLKILDVIMSNAKFANISSVTNAEEKNVVLQNALSLKGKKFLDEYDFFPYRIQLILSFILIIFILRNLSHEVYSYLYCNIDINITML
jgi:hypothetical protein